MRKAGFLYLLISVYASFGQQSDFSDISFEKADQIAKSTKTKNLLELHNFTLQLTEDLDTDVEKVRAIYMWICHNIANDFNLYALNNRKKNKFVRDSIRLTEWNSRFKRILFKKLLKKKRTICTGYAYLFSEMCMIAGIECNIVNGFGRTAEVDVTALHFPNHSWNAVKLNNKWYLCDPTWATGISYPEEGTFVFNYNDGYFLTDPALFINNHFPLNSSFTLLKNDIPTFQEFSELPLLYNKAYEVLSTSKAPQKMHHTVQINQTFSFEYELKKKIDLEKIKLIFSNGSFDKTIRPEISLIKNTLILQHTFKKRGFYDVHVYLADEIMTTYTFKIIREE